jgi:hypothetical protein
VHVIAETGGKPITPATVATALKVPFVHAGTIAKATARFNQKLATSSLES